MPNRSRIPTSIYDFNTYLETTDSYFAEGAPETNAARLGILETEQQSWHGFLESWSPLFPIYENRRNSRTMLVTDELHSIINQVKTYDKEHRILDRIAASPNVTVTDLSVFNIKSGALAKKSRTKPTNPIEALVVPDIDQIGGGELALKCRNNMDNRTAIVPDASCVEYRYLIGETPPTSPDQAGLQQDLSTRASFVVNMGSGNAGKNVYLYFRWNNTKYPALAGPWSHVYPVLIV